MPSEKRGAMAADPAIVGVEGPARELTLGEMARARSASRARDSKRDSREEARRDGGSGAGADVWAEAAGQRAALFAHGRNRNRRGDRKCGESSRRISFGAGCSICGGTSGIRIGICRLSKS